jgi:hypothetical protein
MIMKNCRERKVLFSVFWCVTIIIRLCITYVEMGLVTLKEGQGYNVEHVLYKNGEIQSRFQTSSHLA